MARLITEDVSNDLENAGYQNWSVRPEAELDHADGNGKKKCSEASNSKNSQGLGGCIAGSLVSDGVIQSNTDSC